MAGKGQLGMPNCTKDKTLSQGTMFSCVNQQKPFNKKLLHTQKNQHPLSLYTGDTSARQQLLCTAIWGTWSEEKPSLRFSVEAENRSIISLRCQSESIVCDLAHTYFTLIIKSLNSIR